MFASINKNHDGQIDLIEYLIYFIDLKKSLTGKKTRQKDRQKDQTVNV